MQAVSAPARKGDLCVVCERTLVMYLGGRPTEEHRRWRVYRVASASRDGQVKVVEAQGVQRHVGELYRDPNRPLYVASRKVIDVEAAIEAAWRERPEGFDSIDEAREFLRRFLR
ncbi:MAG TPA: hypothetical protein VIK75_09725 [Calditerricola sp.]